jgi:RNA polymerase sigma-70 factor (ECF subfamily)
MAINAQVLGDVRRLIQYLPAEQKEIVMMRMYYDMSFKEISEMLDISINTALGRMRYALINLRKLIDQHQMVMTLQ